MSGAQDNRVGVIGGGLGGLAAACTLAARGHAVTLFEANADLGGRALGFEAAGHRFDPAPAVLTMPSVLGRLFAEAGRRPEDYLELVRIEPQWRCFYADGTRLDLTADLALGCSGQGSRDFLNWSKKLHAGAERLLLRRSIGSLRDLLSRRAMWQPGRLFDLLTMRPGRTVAECVRRHVSNAHLVRMLDQFAQEIGSDPNRTPALLCGLAHMQLGEGVWYPRGGTAALPKALAALARELGVELRTGVGVRRILLGDSGAVDGLETDEGERVSFSAVVSNMDAVRTHRELLAGTKAAAKFEKRRSYEPACSGVVLFLGLDRPYEHLAHHNIVFSASAEEEFEAIYRRGEPAADPTCYLTAPAGDTALTVLVHAPSLRPHHDWGRLLPDCRRVILRNLADRAGLTDLERRIRFEAHRTPQDLHDRYRLLDGSLYGLASHGRWFGAFRPANRSPDVPGLYLAGASAHPGSIPPLVLLSGWIAADALDHDRRTFSLGGAAATDQHEEMVPLPVLAPGLAQDAPVLGKEGVYS
jgi:phytoene desaturase